MLSAARARKLVGPHCPLSDEQLMQLCGELYPLARAVVSCYLREGAGSCPPTVERTFATVVDDLPESEREEIEERAAIMEYDGEMSRTEAERAALRLVGSNSTGEAA